MDLTGKIIVSVPSLEDERFFKTVIYMCAHSSEGSMGIIINKPLEDLNFHEIVNVRPKKESHRKVSQPVFFGGPVEFGRGFLLHSTDYFISKATVRLNDQFNLTNSTQALKDICEEKGPASSIFALGYSGWHAGQLEREILEDSWLVAKAHPHIVFANDVDEKYSHSLVSLGIEHAFMANESGQA